MQLRLWNYSSADWGKIRQFKRSSPEGIKYNEQTDSGRFGKCCFSDPRVSVRLKKYGDEGIEATGLCLLKYGRYRTACITGIKFWTNLMLFCVLCVLVVLYGNDLIAAGFFLTGFEAYEVCGDKAGFIARNWSDIQSAGRRGSELQIL